MKIHISGRKVHFPRILVVAMVIILLASSGFALSFSVFERSSILQSTSTFISRDKSETPHFSDSASIIPYSSRVNNSTDKVAYSLAVFNNTLYRGNAQNVGGGYGPASVAYDSQNGDIYVANAGSNSISIVNLSKMQVVGTISMGNSVTLVAYDPFNNQMYAGEYGIDNIYDINTTTKSVTKTFSLGMLPTGFAYDSRNHNMFVIDSNNNYDNGDVAVINSTTNNLTVVMKNVASYPSGFTYDPSNNCLYVSEGFVNEILVYNVTSYSYVNYITLPLNPSGGLVYDSYNHDIYATNASPTGGADGVSVIDPSTDNVITTILVGKMISLFNQNGLALPNGIAYNLFNREVYVTNSASNTISVINTTKNSLETTIPVGNAPTSIVIVQQKESVFVSNYGTGSLTEISSRNNSVTGVISLNTYPEGLAYDPSNSYMYVTDSNSNQVSAINSSTNKVESTINVGQDPIALAYDPYNQNMYVADYGSNSVSVINSSTNRVISNIHAGKGPTSIAYDSLNHNVYVGDYKSGNLSVIDSNNNSILTVFHVGGNPSGVAYDPYDNSIFVASNDNSSVTVVDAANYSITHLIDLNGSMGGDSWPVGIVYVPINHALYIPVYGSNVVDVISSTEYKVTSNVSVVQTPTGITFDPKNDYVYSTGIYGYGISVINPEKNVVVGNINSLNEPVGIAYDQANNLLYAGDMGGGVVSIITPRTHIISVKVYEVSIMEKGLPANLHWYVSVSGQTGVYLSDAYHFSLGNGTYLFRVDNLTSYYTNDCRLTVVVTGSGLNESVVFHHYGYIAGTIYPNGTSLYINGKEMTVTGSSFNFSEAAGNYTVNASKSGYMPYYANFSLRSGSLHELLISLNQISSSPGLSGLKLVGVLVAVLAAIIITIVYVSHRRNKST